MVREPWPPFVGGARVPSDPNLVIIDLFQSSSVNGGESLLADLATYSFSFRYREPTDFTACGELSLPHSTYSGARMTHSTYGS